MGEFISLSNIETGEARRLPTRAHLLRVSATWTSDPESSLLLLGARRQNIFLPFHCTLYDVHGKTDSNHGCVESHDVRG
jgi:hypothetical protein